MHEEENTYRNFLRDYIYFLIENALEAKAEYNKERKVKNKPFYEGQLLSFYRALSILQRKAQAFGISLEEVGLDKINTDKELRTEKGWKVDLESDFD